MAPKAEMFAPGMPFLPSVFHVSKARAHQSSWRKGISETNSKLKIPCSKCMQQLWNWPMTSQADACTTGRCMHVLHALAHDVTGTAWGLKFQVCLWYTFTPATLRAHISGACFKALDIGLTLKCNVMLERPARNKHTGLLGQCISYEKSFVSTTQKFHKDIRKCYDNIYFLVNTNLRWYYDFHCMLWTRKHPMKILRSS